jgi:hypothetical protein
MVLGEQSSALHLLSVAQHSLSDDKEVLQDDAIFAPLHQTDEFRKAFGWLTIEELVERKRASVTPNLAALSRFAKVISKAPEHATFRRAASAAALNAAERTLDLKIPKPWRDVLSAFDGSTLHHGRVHLFSVDELVAAHPRDQAWQGLKVGRHLEHRMV